MSSPDANKEASKEKGGEGETKKKKFPILITGIIGLVMGGTGFMVPMFLPGLFRGTTPAESEETGEATTPAKAEKGDAHKSPDKESGHGGSGHAATASSAGGGHAAPAHGEGGEAEHTGTPGQPSFIKFGQMIVNLNSNRMDRYLRMLIFLQVDGEHYEEVLEKMEHRKVQLKSWMVAYLSDVALEDIRGTAGQNRLRRDIQDHFNTTLFEDGHDRIQDVLFEEFTIQ